MHGTWSVVFLDNVSIADFRSVEFARFHRQSFDANARALAGPIAHRVVPDNRPNNGTVTLIDHASESDDSSQYDAISIAVQTGESDDTPQ